MLLVVAALPRIVWAFDELFESWRVPATLLSIPKAGVGVQLDAVPLVALGTVPAVALVAFVQPCAMVQLVSLPRIPPVEVTSPLDNPVSVTEATVSAPLVVTPAFVLPRFSVLVLVVTERVAMAGLDPEPLITKLPEVLLLPSTVKDPTVAF